jgi:hypothetical protein
MASLTDEQLDWVLKFCGVDTLADAQRRVGIKDIFDEGQALGGSSPQDNPYDDDDQTLERSGDDVMDELADPPSSPEQEPFGAIDSYRELQRAGSLHDSNTGELISRDEHIWARGNIERITTNPATGETPMTDELYQNMTALRTQLDTAYAGKDDGDNAAGRAFDNAQAEGRPLAPAEAYDMGPQAAMDRELAAGVDDPSVTPDRVGTTLRGQMGYLFEAGTPMAQKELAGVTDAELDDAFSQPWDGEPGSPGGGNSGGDTGPSDPAAQGTLAQDGDETAPEVPDGVETEAASGDFPSNSTSARGDPATDGVAELQLADVTAPAPDPAPTTQSTAPFRCGQEVRIPYQVSHIDRKLVSDLEVRARLKRDA